ncbi:unnamed protein product [Prorocentrum cordatum]|uniref:Carbohydrate-binding domain-containing protein n=1 Tax=Prorocentrum cordatum TaxID=2364126 RepID=A0ABN9W5L0_9DINO|nr:unnamed protein product [Polarella glacialis]
MLRRKAPARRRGRLAALKRAAGRKVTVLRNAGLPPSAGHGAGVVGISDDELQRLRAGASRLAGARPGPSGATIYPATQQRARFDPVYEVAVALVVRYSSWVWGQRASQRARASIAQRIGWYMWFSLVLVTDEEQHINLLATSPSDLKPYLVEGVSRWQGRRILSHFGGAHPTGLIWTRTLRLCAGGKGAAVAKGPAATGLRIHWAGTPWTRQGQLDVGVAPDGSCLACRAEAGTPGQRLHDCGALLRARQASPPGGSELGTACFVANRSSVEQDVLPDRLQQMWTTMRDKGLQAGGVVVADFSGFAHEIGPPALPPRAPPAADEAGVRLRGDWGGTSDEQRGNIAFTDGSGLASSMAQLVTELLGQQARFVATGLPALGQEASSWGPGPERAKSVHATVWRHLRQQPCRPEVFWVPARQDVDGHLAAGFHPVLYAGNLWVHTEFYAIEVQYFQADGGLHRMGHAALPGHGDWAPEARDVPAAPPPPPVPRLTAVEHPLVRAQGKHGMLCTERGRRSRIEAGAAAQQFVRSSCLLTPLARLRAAAEAAHFGAGPCWMGDAEGPGAEARQQCDGGKPCKLAQRRAAGRPPTMGHRQRTYVSNLAARRGRLLRGLDPKTSRSWATGTLAHDERSSVDDSSEEGTDEAVVAHGYAEAPLADAQGTATRGRCGGALRLARLAWQALPLVGAGSVPTAQVYEALADTGCVAGDRAESWAVRRQALLRRPQARAERLCGGVGAVPREAPAGFAARLRRRGVRVALPPPRAALPQRLPRPLALERRLGRWGRWWIEPLLDADGAASDWLDHCVPYAEAVLAQPRWRRFPRAMDSAAQQLAEARCRRAWRRGARVRGTCARRRLGLALSQRCATDSMQRALPERALSLSLCAPSGGGGALRWPQAAFPRAAEDNFLDLAGPRFENLGAVSWKEASREYAERFTGERNPTKVKVRWDDAFVYIGATLRSRHVAATVAGHCDELESSVWRDTPVLPYFDDDFEVFVDASQDNYFYVEYEMNARNASYGTLWSLPQAGLGSVAPECGGGSSARRSCCNTTWNGGRSLCDKGVESEAAGWTMEMFDASRRPGGGMLSAARNGTDGWSLEIRFPILSTGDHGGLINLAPGSHYPGQDPREFDPNRGQRFWWATFANALHAPWWSTLTSADAGDPTRIKSLCQQVLAEDLRRNGYSQFLIDANNAAPTCYYEAASQHLGGHQYMHNPDNFGYLQFAAHGEPRCRNVQWPARFVLAMVYQAEVQWLTNVSLGNGSYSTSVARLLSPDACTIENACNATALQQALQHVSLKVDAAEGEKAGGCARYAVGAWQTPNWTGGPCFSASVEYVVRNRADPAESRTVAGTINEAPPPPPPPVSASGGTARTPAGYAWTASTCSRPRRGRSTCEAWSRLEV